LRRLDYLVERDAGVELDPIQPAAPLNRKRQVGRPLLIGGEGIECCPRQRHPLGAQM
jgi:hypothetical protein